MSTTFVASGKICKLLFFSFEGFHRDSFFFSTITESIFNEMQIKDCQPSSFYTKCIGDLDITSEND